MPFVARPADAPANDETLVWPDDDDLDAIRRGPGLVCPGCGELMYLRDSTTTKNGVFRAAHFAHSPSPAAPADSPVNDASGDNVDTDTGDGTGTGDDPCSFRGGESDRHRLMKYVLGRWLVDEQFSDEATTVEYEAATGDSGRIADVRMTFADPHEWWGNGIAGEVQYRNTGKDTTAVERDHLDAGYSVCWATEDDFTDESPLSIAFPPELVSVWPNAVPPEHEWTGRPPANVVPRTARDCHRWELNAKDRYIRRSTELPMINLPPVTIPPVCLPRVEVWPGRAPGVEDVAAVAATAPPPDLPPVTFPHPVVYDLLFEATPRLIVLSQYQPDDPPTVWADRDAALTTDTYRVLAVIRNCASDSLGGSASFEAVVAGVAARDDLDLSASEVAVHVELLIHSALVTDTRGRLWPV